MRLGDFGWLIVILFLITGSAFAQSGWKYVVVKQEFIEQRLRAVSKDDTERESILKKTFSEVGCGAQISERPVKHLKQPNLVCILPGEKDRTIIVGAHFDHAPAGDGVVDHWSGASLLPSLYQGLHSKKPRHTFVFVSFSGEERGDLGSASYVDNMTNEDVERTSAMVNMDTLGLGTTAVWVSHSAPKLVLALGAVAKALKLPVSAVNVERVGSTDSEQFARRQIPRITIHSLTQATLPIIHSARDNVSAVKLNDYYESYRLIAAYLSYLDQTLDAEQENPK